MGISLRRPDRAPAAAAAAGGRRSRSTCRRGAGWARAGDAPRSRSAALLLAAWSARSPGSSSCCPVDRLAVVFVVDLSDSVGTAGPRGGARVPARVAGGEAGRGRRGDRRVRRATRWSSGSRRTSPRSTGSPRRRSATRPTSAPRCGSPAPCSPTTPRSGSSCCRTATTRPARASRRRRSPRRAGSRSRPSSTGLAGRDEVLVERLDGAVDRPPRRVGRGVGRHHLDRRPARDRAAVRQRRAGRHQARRPRRRARTGSRSCSRPRTRGSCASGWSSRPPATRSTRTTAPRRTRSSRASPRCSSSRATRTSRPSSSTALETERQVVDTVIPEGLPSDLAGLADYDSIVLVDVPRLRLTDQAMARAPGRTCGTSGGAW